MVYICFNCYILISAMIVGKIETITTTTEAKKWIRTFYYHITNRTRNAHWSLYIHIYILYVVCMHVNSTIDFSNKPKKIQESLYKCTIYTNLDCMYGENCTIRITSFGIAWVLLHFVMLRQVFNLSPTFFFYLFHLITFFSMHLNDLLYSFSF